MNRSLFLLSFLMTSYVAFAQLKVNTNGYVGIATTPDSDYALRVSCPHTGYGGIASYRSSTIVPNSSAPWTQAIHGEQNHQSAAYSQGVRGIAHAGSPTGMGRCYGVFGGAGNATNGYNYSLYGILLSETNGAGVYGTAYKWDYGQCLDSRYAGYFYGPVKVQGNLTVTGNISGIVLGQSALPSVSQRHTSMNVSNQISSLELSTYYREKPLYSSANNPTDTVEFERPLCDMEKQVLSKQHYGLDAAQLEEVFPDLVYENADGSKSINYMEMVPILVQAINELKAEINELKGTGVRKVQQTSAVESLIETTDAPALGQNVPNPFSSSTAIQVNIPESVQNAVICLYDLQGKKVKQMDIAARGKHSIKLSSTGLEEGMYLYSLITDGKVVQTRRMILEK